MINDFMEIASDWNAEEVAIFDAKLQSIGTINRIISFG
jgi:hypothetical protein